MIANVTTDSCHICSHSTVAKLKTFIIRKFAILMVVGVTTLKSIEK